MAPAQSTTPRCAVHSVDQPRFNSVVQRYARSRAPQSVERCALQAGIEYAERLKVLAEQHAKDLLVVMRVYFEKPRTTIGWKVRCGCRTAALSSG